MTKIEKLINADVFMQENPECTDIRCPYWKECSSRGIPMEECIVEYLEESSWIPEEIFDSRRDIQCI